MAVMVGVRQDVSIMELPESDHGLAVKSAAPRPEHGYPRERL